MSQETLELIVELIRDGKAKVVRKRGKLMVVGSV